MGDKIRELRKSHNLSQEQLAEIIGSSAKTISDYENDKVKKPNVHILKEIANHFNVPLSYLLS